jgi:hypothetical protein
VEAQDRAMGVTEQETLIRNRQDMLLAQAATVPQVALMARRPQAT